MGRWARPSSELEQVYQRKRERSRGVWSRKIDFPDHTPKRNDLRLPCLKHRGFPVRFLEPCGMLRAHLHTSSRSSKHLPFSYSSDAPGGCLVLAYLCDTYMRRYEDWTPTRGVATVLLYHSTYKQAFVCDTIQLSAGNFAASNYDERRD